MVSSVIESHPDTPGRLRVTPAQLVARKPVLLQEFGRAIEERQTAVRQALSATD